jgi:hypothetical protein
MADEFVPEPVTKTVPSVYLIGIQGITTGLTGKEMYGFDTGTARFDQMIYINSLICYRHHFPESDIHFK